MEGGIKGFTNRREKTYRRYGGKGERKGETCIFLGGFMEEGQYQRGAMGGNLRSVKVGTPVEEKSPLSPAIKKKGITEWENSTVP